MIPYFSKSCLLPLTYACQKGLLSASLVTRVNKDKAGGLITGPGSVGVFVEGFKVSLSKDEIKSHGDSPHDAATTAEPSTTVFAT